MKKKVKSILLILAFSMFLFTASCSHQQVMKDYYKTMRQSELAKMSALRSFVRSSQSMRQSNITMMNKAGKDAGIIALSNAIMSMNESRTIEAALTTWYGQRMEQPKSETASVLSSMSWLGAPLGIVAGGWAIGYVLRGVDQGSSNISNSYNKTESDNQLNGSHRDMRFSGDDSAVDASHNPQFSPYSPGSSDSIFGSFSPGSTDNTIPGVN